MEKVRGWASKRPLEWMMGTLVVGLIVGGAIGALAGSAGKSALESDKSQLESEVASVTRERDRARGEIAAAEEEVSAAESRASRIEGLRGKIVGEAEDKAADLTARAERDERAAESKLHRLEGKLDVSESRLAGVRESLSGAQEEKRLSRIPSTGTFQAEVDFMPGTYRASGGPYCYWATLNSADPYDIASNENASGPTIAAIHTPYFQTQECGRWERIGE